MNKKALIIGNWNFSDKKIKKLKSPKNDIENLSITLRDSINNEFDIHTLKNPLYEEVLKETNNFFLQNSGPENTLFFYFSGYIEKDVENNTLYFYHKNTDLKNVESTSLSSTIINNLIKKSEGAKIVIVIDSCMKNPCNENNDNYNSDFMIEGSDCALISSSRLYNSSYEKNNKSNSEFTSHLIDSLENPELNDINEMYLDIFNKMADSIYCNHPIRRINSTGKLSLKTDNFVYKNVKVLIPPEKISPITDLFNKTSEGWNQINENEIYSFFVLYAELNYNTDTYEVEKLWEEYFESYICSTVLDSNSTWKKYCGNDVSKKRIYVAPVREENMPIILSIFKSFLNKQVEDIRLNSIEIRNKYYLTAINLQYKNLDSSALLDPSCSNVYKLADSLDTDKLYLSGDVIDLLPHNIRKNLKPISHKSEIFTYSFNLLT